jgi:hypothetical protein
MELARRLEFEFDNEVSEEEEEIVIKPLDIVFVAHIQSTKNETGEFECPICYENIQKAERVTISCRHDFCGKCTQDLLKTCCLDGKNATCPMCRYPCFLVETPDPTQFEELSELLEIIQDERDRENDRQDMNAFLYYHFAQQYS